MTDPTVTDTSRPDPATPEKDRAADAIRAAYWKLQRHAVSYRGTDTFQRRQTAHRAAPRNPELARGAARDEWYARGIEAAARDLAEILEAEHETDVGAEVTGALRDRAIALALTPGEIWSLIVHLSVHAPNALQDALDHVEADRPNWVPGGTA